MIRQKQALYRSRGKRQRLNSEVCFLCEKGAQEDDGGLRQVSTLETDQI